MTITKYPQSCLKIEKVGRALLIDPGIIATAAYRVEDFGEFDAVIYTHRHSDHLDPDIIDELIESGATLYGNKDVCEQVGPDKIETIEEGEELVIAGFKVKSKHMEHCLMIDGSKGVPNTGYLIDDHLLIPGDSTEDVGFKARLVALPVFGPDISFHDAYRLLEATGAKQVVPVHFDIVHMDPSSFASFYNLTAKSGSEVVVIENGSSRDFTS